ncbi:hypothetical protein KDL29_11635 [bacterium]|nr:hypothetical protein [bacterium]MCB1220802.1 hypothetical protein [bacterium]UNM09450.1 MAG: hypothetical protein H7A35_05185 [Planctomycetales bacterium]
MQQITARMLLLALVLVTGLGFSCNKTNQAGSGGGGTVSSGGNALQPNPATDFSFKTTGGQTQTTAQYLGKPLVVNFWADW